MDANQRSLQIEAEKTNGDLRYNWDIANGDLRYNIANKGGEHKLI